MAGTHLESNLGHLAYGHIRRLRVGGCSSVAEHWLHKPGVLGVDFQWLPNIFKLRFRILLSMFFFLHSGSQTRRNLRFRIGPESELV